MHDKELIENGADSAAQPKKHKIFSIEFLRIFFVFFIILGHIKEMYPDVNTQVLSFFDTQKMHTWFGVEFFFILGGFFLYKKIKNLSHPFDIAKKLWLRLVPALLFVFLLVYLLGTKNPDLYISRLPLITTLTAGIGLPGEATGWGDWYVSTYFWCCLLYVGIFYASYKRAFLWTGILMYLTICLKFHGPYTWMGTYYDIICTDFIRGIYSVGLGIVTAYLSDKIKMIPTRGIRLFCTMVEIYCLISIFNYIARASFSYFTFWEIELVFAALVVCAAHSFGYITEFLNKLSFIQFASRYVYSIFLCHIACMSILWSHGHYGLSNITCAYVVFTGAILLGIFEYHVIEQKLVPWISEHLTGDGAVASC